MRYIKIVILIFIITSCQRLKDVEMTVENNTEYQIQIESFFEGDILETILIEPYGSYGNLQRFHPEDSHLCIFNRTTIDSVNIFFGNERIIVQSCGNTYLNTCLDVERNILHISNYDKEDLGKRSSRYAYTITEEDFKNAVPIKD